MKKMQARKIAQSKLINYLESAWYDLSDDEDFTESEKELIREELHIQEARILKLFNLSWA